MYHSPSFNFCKSNVYDKNHDITELLINKQNFKTYKSCIINSITFLKKSSITNLFIQNIEYNEDRTKIIIVVKFGIYRIRALLDTGAEISVIDYNVVKKMHGIGADFKPIELNYAQKGTIGTAKGQISKPTTISIGKGRFTRSQPLILDLASNEYEMILSLEDMEKLGMTISGLPNPASIDDDRAQIEEELLAEPANTLDTEDHAKVKQTCFHELQNNQHIQLNDWCTLKDAEVSFEVNEEKLKNTKFIHRNFVPKHWTEITTQTVSTWYNQGIIEKVEGKKSPVNLPLIAVPQLDTAGTLKKVRICLDLRLINQLVSMDRFEVPSIRETIQSIRKRKFFTSLDLKSGYNQMKVVEKCRKYLTFTWNNQQWRHTGAPFGLNFLPNWFHRHLAHLFGDLSDVYVYLDDILVASETESEHRELVKEVIRRLNKANLRLNIDKCLFGVTQVLFLGFKISDKGIAIDPERNKRLLDIYTPSTGKDLQSVLGMFNFVREHIPDYGRIASPLYELTKVKILNDEEKWIHGGLQAFEKIKAALIKPTVLQWPLDGKKFHLKTDSSESGYGGVLYQIDDNNKTRIIQMFSGGYKNAQHNYSIPKKELFAIVFALKHLRWYLRGSHFSLYTDNMSLSHMYTCEIDKSAISKWFDILSDYSFDITHVPRENNIHADVCSKVSPDAVHLNKVHHITNKSWHHLGNNSSNPTVMSINMFDTNTKINTKQGHTVSANCNNCHISLSEAIKLRNDEQDSNSNKLKKDKVQHSYTNSKNVNFINNITVASQARTKRKSTCDWKLRTDLFNIAEDKYGPHTVDLMAARHNTQLERYFDVDDDAFTIDWSKENGWCNPPFHLINEVLDHITKTQCTVTLCLPFWTNSKWYDKWKHMVVEDPIILPNNVDTFLRENKQIVTNTPWRFTMLTRVSGVKSKQTKITDTFYISLLNNIDYNINRYGYRKNDLLHGNKQSYNVCTVATIPTTEHRQVTDHDMTDEVLEVNITNSEECEQALPRDNCEFNENAILSEDEKLQIAIAYHNRTHSYPEYVAASIEHTGKYKWDNLMDIVEKADAQCLHCELNRIAKVGYHPLKSIRGEFVGDKWVIDLIPLPKEVSDTKFVLHILDVYSGYNILRATEAKTGVAVAKALYAVMCDHGYPRMMIHDRGSEFINKHVQEMLEVLSGMLTSGGAPYSPMCQGSNERRHGQIRNLIKEQLGSYTDNWIDALPAVQMKLNFQLTRKHRSIPFSVYYGRTHNAFACNKGTTESWMQRLDKLEKHVHPTLRKMVNTYHDKSEQYFNHGKRKRGLMKSYYKPGDVVKMRNLNSKGTKLDNYYKGPYMIHQRVGDKHYDLVDVDCNVIDIINAHPVPIEQLADWERSDIITKEGEACVFKKILTHNKTISGVNQYHVLWSDNSTSWEYKEQFSDVSAINRYHARLLKPKRQRRKRKL